jgi:hypothetical protein
MANDYEDPPVNTRRGRASTWVAVGLILLVLGFIVAYGWRTWGTRDEAYHGSMRTPPPPAAHLA